MYIRVTIFQTRVHQSYYLSNLCTSELLFFKLVFIRVSFFKLVYIRVTVFQTRIHQSNYLSNLCTSDLLFIKLVCIRVTIWQTGVHQSYYLSIVHIRVIIFSAGHARCLEDSSSSNQLVEDELELTLAGELFNATKQCQYVFGKTTSICPYMVSAAAERHHRQIPDSIHSSRRDEISYRY